VTGLGENLAGKLGQATFLKTAELGFANAKKNSPYIKKTIHELKGGAPPSESAIVICAGPSLHHRQSIQHIKDSGYAGALVVADGALRHCLAQGVIPDYVITLDPHPDRIVRWFGDPKLSQRPDDDYFRRQDLDPAFHNDEKRKNEELIELVNRHGPRIKVVIATCIDPAVTERCLEARMELFWWNPIYDDYDAPESYTRKVYEMNGVPCLVTGGNCGSAAWVFTHSVLGRHHVGLVGMDLGYRPGTPLLNTQYYYQLRDVLGDRVAEAYIKVPNPYLSEEWFTDPTYYWYRSIFLSMAQDAPCRTYNCTEGGTVFGPGIDFIPLAQFLAQFSVRP
jgi:hypothetical protein